MRMPGFRFTFRRMIIAVACLSVPIASVTWVLRNQERARLFNRWYYHKNLAYNIWVFIGGEQSRSLPNGVVSYRPGTPPDVYLNAEWDEYLKTLPPQERADWQAIARRYEYHLEMWHKWERAAPWSYVEPDPPAPSVPGRDGVYPF